MAYKDLSEKRKKGIAASVDKRRKKNKELLVESKGGKCERCGYDKCIAALEFHHLDPSTKEFSLTGNTYGLARQMKEAEKCILVCANCHREIHNGV